MSIDGQLEFNGREVTAIKTKWGDLALDYLPNGLNRDDLAATDNGDEFECVVRFKVESIGHRDKTDRQGVATSPLTREVTLKMLESDFRVSAIRRRADIESTPWEQTA